MHQIDGRLSDASMVPVEEVGAAGCDGVDDRLIDGSTSQSSQVVGRVQTIQIVEKSPIKGDDAELIARQRLGQEFVW